MSPAQVAKPIARPLLRWFGEHARDLPWRGTRDPYRIWVSEIMLQQTQVDTVLRYYDAFLARFPTVIDLAAASEQDVLAAWSGLGFYRRARNLHRAARQVVSELGGVLPREPKPLQALPGLGRYTVGAILSIAHDRRLPILDGNVIRVLSRVFRVAGDPKAGPANKELWRLAEAVLPAARAGDFNQSLMELGALVCRPTQPKCGECPLAALCGAHEAGEEEAFPTPTRRAAVPEVERVALYLERPDGRFVVERRPAEGLLASMWELPSLDLPRRARAATVAARLARRLGTRARPALRGSAQHRFSHRLWTIHVFQASTRAQAATQRGRWVDRRELDALAVPTATRKVLRVAWAGEEA